MLKYENRYCFNFVLTTVTISKQNTVGMKYVKVTSHPVDKVQYASGGITGI
jgi:hypothetical protein